MKHLDKESLTCQQSRRSTFLVMVRIHLVELDDSKDRKYTMELYISGSRAQIEPKAGSSLQCLKFRSLLMNWNSDATRPTQLIKTPYKYTGEKMIFKKRFRKPRNLTGAYLQSQSLRWSTQLLVPQNTEQDSCLFF